MIGRVAAKLASGGRKSRRLYESTVFGLSKKGRQVKGNAKFAKERAKEEALGLFSGSKKKRAARLKALKEKK